MALVPALDLRAQHGGDPRDAKPDVPASVEAEQGFLGAILYEAGYIRLLKVELRPEHFYEPFHGRLYQAICETVELGEAPEPTLLHEEFRRDPAYLELGGVRYLADMIDRAPPAIRAGDFAAHILDLHHKRELLRIASELQAAVRNGDQTSRALTQQLDTDLAQIRLAQADPAAFITARQAAVTALEEIRRESDDGKPRGAHCGLTCFDGRLGGLIPGRLITIGGRPGMGKTALLRAALYGAASWNSARTFGMFSLETQNREMSERAISAGTTRGRDWLEVKEQGSGAVQYSVLSRSNIGITELPWLEESVAGQPENLFLFDQPRLNLYEIQRNVWALKARGDLAAIGIDYLQLMQRPETRGRNDAALIGDITQGLKVLAAEAKICILLVSQLNRGVDTRDDKRPTLSDLRESGSIEQDSDIVMFPFRQSYYLERAEPQGSKTSSEYIEWIGKLAEVEDLMEVITAKLRQGRIGTDRQTYLAPYDAVSNWTKG
jgi:replicative DNA helicase